MDQLTLVIAQDVLGLPDRRGRRHRHQYVVLQRILVRPELDRQLALLPHCQIAILQVSLHPRRRIAFSHRDFPWSVDAHDRPFGQLQHCRHLGLETPAIGHFLAARRHRPGCGLALGRQHRHLQEAHQGHRRRVHPAQQRRTLNHPRLLGKDHATRHHRVQSIERLAPLGPRQPRRLGGFGQQLQPAGALERPQQPELVELSTVRQFRVGIDVGRQLLDHEALHRIVRHHVPGQLAVHLDRHRLQAVLIRIETCRGLHVFPARLDAGIHQLHGVGQEPRRFGHGLVVAHVAQPRVQVAIHPSGPARVRRHAGPRAKLRAAVVEKPRAQIADVTQQVGPQGRRHALIVQQLARDRVQDRRPRRDPGRQRLGVRKPRVRRRHHVHHHALHQRAGAGKTHRRFTSFQGNRPPPAELQPGPRHRLLAQVAHRQRPPIAHLTLWIHEQKRHRPRLPARPRQRQRLVSRRHVLRPGAVHARAARLRLQRQLGVVHRQHAHVQLGTRHEKPGQFRVDRGGALHVGIALGIAPVQALDRDEAHGHPAGLRRQRHVHGQLAVRSGVHELAKHHLLLALAHHALASRVAVVAVAMSARRTCHHRLPADAGPAVAHAAAATAAAAEADAAAAHRTVFAQHHLVARLPRLLARFHLVAPPFLLFALLLLEFSLARLGFLAFALLFQLDWIDPTGDVARRRAHAVAHRRSQGPGRTRRRHPVVVHFQHARHRRALTVGAHHQHVHRQIAQRFTGLRRRQGHVPGRRRKRHRPALAQAALVHGADRHQRIGWRHLQLHDIAGLEHARDLLLARLQRAVGLHRPHERLGALHRQPHGDCHLAVDRDHARQFEGVVEGRRSLLDEHLPARHLHSALVRRQAGVVGPAHATARQHQVALDVPRAFELVAQAAVRRDELDLERPRVPAHVQRRGNLTVHRAQLHARSRGNTVATCEHAPADQFDLAGVRFVVDPQLVLERQAVAPPAAGRRIAQEPAAFHLVQLGGTGRLLHLVAERQGTERALDHRERCMRLGLAVQGRDVRPVFAELQAIGGAVEQRQHRQAFGVQGHRELGRRRVALLESHLDRLVGPPGHGDLEMGLLIGPELRLIHRRRSQLHRQPAGQVARRPDQGRALRVQVEQPGVATRNRRRGAGLRGQRGDDQGSQEQGEGETTQHGRPRGTGRGIARLWSKTRELARRSTLRLQRLPAAP